MPFTDEDKQNTNDALQSWRQGDVSLDPALEVFHLADLSQPHSDVSRSVSNKVPEELTSQPNITPVKEMVEGVVMLTQTCDIVRCCEEKQFVQVAPLVKFNQTKVEETRKLKRPQYAYIPAVASQFLVADLSRCVTLEKVIVARWKRIQGCNNDKERMDFALALIRNRTRFAFPDDFIEASQEFQKFILKKHKKQTTEGEFLRAIREIRVKAAPSWNIDKIKLTWWFIKEEGPSVDLDEWYKFIEKLMDKFDQSGKYDVEDIFPCELADMTALDYTESNHLDLDQLSIN